MEVNYFFRGSRNAFSIEKVFSTIISSMPENVVTRCVYLPEVNGSPMAILKNIWFTYQNRNKLGINHVTGDIHYCVIGLIGCKTVLTIHDLVFLKNARNPIDRFIKYIFWLYLPIKLSDKVVCISQSTKTDLLQYIEIEDVQVINNPVKETIVNGLSKVGEVPVILHIGVGWNKNLERVIEALSGLDCVLRIIGKISVGHIELLQKYNIAYSYTYSLSDEEIVSEYNNCDVVSFPSLYEGFGMPIIEGQAVGRVILTSDINPMKEIGGDGAHYVDPTNVMSIRNGFYKLISDNDYRKKLIENGFANVKSYSCRSISSKYVELYNSFYK